MENPYNDVIAESVREVERVKEEKFKEQTSEVELNPLQIVGSQFDLISSSVRKAFKVGKDVEVIEEHYE